MTTASHAPAGERRRTGWDIGLGVLMIISAFVILGDVALATAISVKLIGWTALIAGVVMLGGTLWRLRSGGSWSPVLGAAGLAVLAAVRARGVDADERDALAARLEVGARAVDVDVAADDVLQRRAHRFGSPVATLRIVEQRM